MKKFLIAAAAVVLVAFAAPLFAATNPFMDVPASHWAYDAVAQLASRGVISGYPDGSYKGAQPATRYEMASVVARAMAKIDMEKASKQDVEMLKKLIVEFKDELDALGVKVDGIDERLAVMERDLGGWSLSGQFRFDANFGTDDNLDAAGNGWYGDDMRQRGANDFDLNRFRIFLRKRINDTTSFTARIGSQGASRNSNDWNGHPNMRWERYYIETKLGYDISMTVGRSAFDWEDQLGLYATNDAFFGDWATNMFHFKKDWGMANLEFVVGRMNDDLGDPSWEYFLVAGLANFNITERFYAGVMAYYMWSDDDVPNILPGGGDLDNNLLTAGVYFGFNFTPSVALKGLYYYQDQGDALMMTNDDNANMWKVIIDVDQDALKFTSLWIEYNQIDNNFWHNDYSRLGQTATYAFSGATLLGNQPWNDNTTKVYGAIAKQQWNDKWRTWLGWYHADFDTNFLDDADNWTIGVGYRLNPNVEFELSYDKIDYGDGNTGLWPTGGYDRFGDDHLVRFRTFVTF